MLVGVERTPERKVFVVHVERRNAETLLPVILAHVRAGSVIHTDCWGRIPNYQTFQKRITNMPQLTILGILGIR